MESKKLITIYDVLKSPVGSLAIVATDAGLQRILWDTDRLNDIKKKPHHPIIQKTKTQLTEYFNAKRKKFDIPLDMQGTPFQQQAWQQLAKIPYGETISYGEQAHRLGDKNKARAVGIANSKNPIPIIIPCHRVIGSNGKLTGFTGGLDKKELLLQLEQ